MFFLVHCTDHELHQIGSVSLAMAEGCTYLEKL